MRALTFILAGIALPLSGLQAAEFGGCRFDSNAGQFRGNKGQQLDCLLKRVRPRGAGADVQPIPAWLGAKVWTTFVPTTAQLNAALQAAGADASTLTPRLLTGDRTSLRYFVIHDTSSPEISAPSFPANMNTGAYSGNRLTGWRSMDGRINLIISRDGRSRPIVDWGATRNRPATKIEQSDRAGAWRRTFVHVENIQPRLKPAGSWAWIAPEPGLSAAQEQRLALAYIIASARAGRWLMPAYHFNIDQGLPDGHDDPQKMNLASWSARVEAIAAAMN